MFLTIADGGPLIYVSLLCEGKTTYYFSIDNSFKLLQASIKQIVKKNIYISGACV